MEFNARKVKWGIILITAGALLLAHNYGLLSFELKFSRDWPVILIAIGLLGAWDGIVCRSRRNPPRRENPETKKTIKDILEGIEKGEISAEEGARKMKD